MEQLSLSDSPDWAHLPLAAVLLISQKVKSLADYVRFRAVCSPWRSASHPRPHHRLPPQRPWLMIPYDPDRSSGEAKDDGVRLFYDLWESKMRKLHLPETIGMACCATYRGWLLLVGILGCRVSLLNPTTRARVQLPPFTVPAKYFKEKPGYPVPRYDASHCFEPPMGSFAITRVTFSTDLTDPDCLITVFVQRFWGIFCCRVGDSFWTEVNFRPSSFEFADATCHNGLFYLLSKGSMSITDPNDPDTLSICFLDEKLRDASVSFLHEKSGIYLVAIHNIKEEAADDAKDGTKKTVKQKFELYQYQKDVRKLKKTLIDSNADQITDPISTFKQIAATSDTTIFFGDNQHFLAVCSDDWELLEGGSMYMEYKHAPPSAGGTPGSGYYSIYHSKLDDIKFEPVVRDIAKEPPIFPPAPAMWFQPSYV